MRPYDPNLDDPNAEDTTQSSVQTSAIAPGQTGAIASGGQGQGGTSEQKGSGRWTNLNSYLDANRDSSLGSDLVGKVQGEVDNAKNTQNDSAAEFGNRVNGQTTNYNADLVGRATTDSANFVKNAGDVDAFKKQRDALYKGPNNFSDASDLYSKTAGATNAASAKADNLKSEGGRWQLLDNYFGGKDYNSGQKSLDSLVATSANPDSYSAGAGMAGKGADDAKANLNQMAQNLGAQAAQGRGATETARNQTRGALGIDNANQRTGKGALGTAEGEVKSQYDKAISDRDKSIAQLKADLADPTKQRDALTRVGAPVPDLLYKEDPTKYVRSYDTTAGNLASPEQRAKLNALSQLSDLSNMYEPTGDTPKSLYGYDAEGFQKGVTGRKEDFETQSRNLAFEYTNTQNSVRSLEQQADELQKSLATLQSQSGMDIGGQRQSQVGMLQNAIANNAASLDAARKQLMDVSDRARGLRTDYGVPMDAFYQGDTVTAAPRNPGVNNYKTFSRGSNVG